MANKTALFVRKQVGGIFTVIDQSLTTGDIWFVDSNTGTDGAGYGQNPDSPLASVDYAIGLATASKGDIIYVMPGHAETAATEDQELFDVDKAAISIIGLGVGDKRPTFTFTDDGATVVIGAAGCRLSNLRFIGGVTDMATCLEIEAAGAGSVVDRCYFADSATDEDMLIAISVAAAANNLQIEDNQFNITTGGEATDCIKLAGASTGTIIARNIATGDWKTGGFVNGATAAAANLMIVHNLVVNQDASAGLCIKLHASSTGGIFRNMLAGNKANTEPISTVTAMHVAENYMTDTAAASGIISATVTAWT